MKYLIILLLIPLTSASLCSDIYFQIIENDWAVNETELSKQHNINFTEFINDWAENCQLTEGYTLPNKTEIPILIINKTKVECETEVNNYLDISFPLPDFQIGDRNCSTIRILKYFFVLEKDNNYTAKQLKIIPVIVIFLFILFIEIFRSNSKLNRLIEKHKRD